MINLGLQRISLLLNPLFAAHPTLPWRAVHVAGTNGKGSVAALVSTFLGHLGYRVGRFTSPHLIDRWDCITINRNVVDRDKFLPIEQRFRKISIDENIGASEFEILTATAFQLFTDEKVDVAVIECGLGGREDATNILRSQDVILSVLTKIGLDHTEFLGDTIEAITTEKVGIFKPGVPVVVDQSNDKAVLEVVRKKLEELGWDKNGQKGAYLSREEEAHEFEMLIRRLRLGQYRAQNLYTAWSAFRHAEESLSILHSGRQPPPTQEPSPPVDPRPGAACLPQEPDARDDDLIYENTPFPVESVKASLEKLVAAAQSSLPGRLQWLTLPSALLSQGLSHASYRTDSRILEAPTTIRVLLDGAHNVQSAEGLASFVDDNLRPETARVPLDRSKPITWLLAMKSDKDVDNILSLMVKHHDHVITCAFGPVDGMPWVKPMPASELAAKARKLTTGTVKAVFDEDEQADRHADHAVPISDAEEPLRDAKVATVIQEALRVASQQEGVVRLCITGSLYLVGDILRCVRNAGGSIYGGGEMGTQDAFGVHMS